MTTNQTQWEAHLQRWLAEPLPTPVLITRLDALNLTQIARLSGLEESTLHQFALGQGTLSPEDLTRLITVVEGLGYEKP